MTLLCVRWHWLMRKLTYCWDTVPFFHCACWRLEHDQSLAKNRVDSELHRRFEPLLSQKLNIHQKPLDTLVRYRPIAVMFVYIVCCLLHLDHLSNTLFSSLRLHAIDNNVFNLVACVRRVIRVSHCVLDIWVLLSKCLNGFEWLWPALMKSSNI